MKVVPNVNQIGKLGTVALERLLAGSVLKHSLGKGEGGTQKGISLDSWRRNTTGLMFTIDWLGRPSKTTKRIFSVKGV